MRLIDGLIGLMWIAFWVYWLVQAFGAKASRTRNRFYLGPRIAVGILIGVAIRGGVFGKHAAATHSTASGLIGLVVVAVGLGLAVWARVYLGGNWGMPMTQRVDPELVTTGPYRTIRHPIYTGLILALVGTSIAITFYALIVAAVAGTYFVFSAKSEERFMVEQFPDTYPAYQRSTKMLIPYLY